MRYQEEYSLTSDNHSVHKICKKEKCDQVFWKALQDREFIISQKTDLRVHYFYHLNVDLNSFSMLSE